MVDRQLPRQPRPTTASSTAAPYCPASSSCADLGVDSHVVGPVLADALDLGRGSGALGQPGRGPSSPAEPSVPPTLVVTAAKSSSRSDVSVPRSMRRRLSSLRDRSARIRARERTMSWSEPSRWERTSAEPCPSMLTSVHATECSHQHRRAEQPHVEEPPGPPRHHDLRRQQEGQHRGTDGHQSRGWARDVPSP